MSAELEIVLIAVVTAVAAALPGAFLVLRRVAMVSDAISHAILPGIVVAFFLTRDLASPLLILAAAATGVLTVALIEAFTRSGLVQEDAAIGLVFPALFSIGVVLISRWAGDVHLDTDAVLLGELAFAPFDRLLVAGIDLGPRSLWMMGGILLVDLVFLGLLFKELKLATIDPQLAAALGFSPVLIHYGLMTVVSVTAVGAFSAVGSILVVALMIAPGATAYLLLDRFGPMLAATAAVAAGSAVAGCAGAFLLDVSIAGAIATVCGLVFAAVFLLAPRRGLIAQVRRRTAQRLDFASRMLLVHILHHEGGPEAKVENAPENLPHHLGWRESFSTRVVRRTLAAGLTEHADGLLQLTYLGRRQASRDLSGLGPARRAEG